MSNSGQKRFGTCFYAYSNVYESVGGLAEPKSFSTRSSTQVRRPRKSKNHIGRQPPIPLAPAIPSRAEGTQHITLRRGTVGFTTPPFTRVHRTRDVHDRTLLYTPARTTHATHAGCRTRDGMRPTLHTALSIHGGGACARCPPDTSCRLPRRAVRTAHARPYQNQGLQGRGWPCAACSHLP